MTQNEDLKFLKVAIEKSKESVAIGGFPVGVVIVQDGKIIGSGVSNGKQLHDATSHGEVAAIREVSKKLGSRNLPNATLYSSLEPCLMCFSACFWAYIPRVVYACSKSKVSKQHYEGSTDINLVNQQNNRKIELIHSAELENEALKIIQDWELNLK